MKIFTCDNCRYIFENEEDVTQCPDCGKFQVRPATQSEAEEFIERKTKDVWAEE